jgi:hypothetical protein
MRTTQLLLDASLRTASFYCDRFLDSRQSAVQCLSVHSEGNATAINELAMKFGGKCSETITSQDGEDRLFLFDKRAIANEFFKAVLLLPEVISVGSMPLS